MAIKPILFNTKMVRALLDGRKTCTRRKIPIDIVNNCDVDTDGTLLAYENCDGDFIESVKLCQYQPGDILYVRETWAWCPCWDCGLDVEETGCGHEQEQKYNGEKKEHGCYIYRASCEDNEYPSADTWHPSIHMPKEAARIWLKVTNVRVERLQEITEDGAKAEGANFKNGKNVGFEEKMNRTAIERFEEIWNSTIKKSDFARYSWDANPWVWVISFERCEKPEE